MGASLHTYKTAATGVWPSKGGAEFRLESAEFNVVDVGSLNGTYVNREPVDSAVLANGDEVQIGKFRLVFLTGPKGDDDGGSGGQ